MNAFHPEQKPTPLPHRRWQPGEIVEAPLRLYHCTVDPAWIDYNQHMTEASYLTAFGDASDALFRFMGIDEAYRAAGHSYYTVETHLNYYRECKSGDSLHFTTQLLDADAKRLHLFHHMFHAATGELVCTTEQMLVHVATAVGRSAPVLPPVQAALEAILAAHRSLPIPQEVGRQMKIVRK